MLCSLQQATNAALIGRAVHPARHADSMAATMGGPILAVLPAGREQSRLLGPLRQGAPTSRQFPGKGQLAVPGTPQGGRSLGVTRGGLNVRRGVHGGPHRHRLLQPPRASSPESADKDRGSAPTAAEETNQPLQSTSSRAAGSFQDGAEQRGLAPEAPYWLITALAATGALETAYLTYEKVLGGPVACPLGGSCNGVLDSPWGTLFGLPLSLYGLVAYAATALLAQGARSDRGTGQGTARWLLLGTTSVMAATSGYLMYILATELEGTSCAYCVASAVLSASLLGATLRGFRRPELQGALTAQAGVAAAVVLGLSVAFSDARSAMAGTEVLDLPPIAPEVSTVSTPPGLALAKHLQAVGAKMYGAFWCSHCHEQKQMFGREAMKYVEYVECYPEGYRRGVTIAAACTEANIQGFPTWIIDGKAIPGEQDFEQLAAASGFDTSTISN